jgi:hypothetical protein
VNTANAPNHSDHSFFGFSIHTVHIATNAKLGSTFNLCVCRNGGITAFGTENFNCRLYLTD